MESTQKIPSRFRSIIYRIFRVFALAIVSVFFILAILALLFQIPAVQNRAKNIALTWLTQKTGTTISAKKITIIFPNMVGLHQFYIEDNKKDTLVFGDYLGVGIGFWDLLDNKISVHNCWLKDAVINLSNDTNAIYNYQHIIDAFAGQSANTVPKDSSALLQINLKTLQLNRIRFVYHDQTGGIFGKFYVHQLRALGDHFDLENQYFSIKKLIWNGGSVALNMWDVKKVIPNEKSDTLPTLLPTLLFGKAAISEVIFSYHNQDAGMVMDANIGFFDGEMVTLGLNNQLIDLGSSTLRNSHYHFISSVPAAPPSPVNPAVSPNWIVKSSNISLLNSGFEYDDNSAAPVKRGMDYGHLSFSRINLTGNNLYVSGGDTVLASVSSGNLREKSGLDVTAFKSNLLYTSQGIRLNNLFLTTPTTKIEDNLEISYKSIDAVTQNPGTLGLNARFKKSKISHKDLLITVPMLYDYPMFANLPNAIMQVNGKVSGQLNNLLFENMTFAGFTGTRLKASGRLIGLPDPYTLTTQLNVTELTTTENDIRKFIPEGMIPDFVTLPATLTAKGSLNGNVSNLLKMNIGLSSSLGGANISGFIEKADNPNLAKYNLQGSLQNTDLGKLLGQPDLGKVSATFSANGSTYVPAKLKGRYSLYIKEAFYLNNPIRDISLLANANEGMVDGQIISNQAGQKFNVDFAANLRNPKPSLFSDIYLHDIDFRQLGLSEIPFSIASTVNVNFEELDPDHPKGSFLIYKTSGIYDTTAFKIDSIRGTASFDGQHQFVQLQSDFIKAEAKGSYSVSALLPEIIDFINPYYALSNPSPSLRGNQQATINLTLLPSPKIAYFLPQLSFSKPAYASLEVDTRLCLFNLKSNLPAMKYGEQGIQAANLFAEANDTAISYKLFVDDYRYGDIYEIPTLLFQGDVVQQNLYTDIRLLDYFGRLQHTLAAKISNKDSGYAIHVDPNSVQLNYDVWRLDPNNELFFSDEGIFANSFTFSNGTQALILQTFGEEVNDPLGIRFFNFNISTITGIARQDSLYLDGMLNGFAEIDFSKEHLFFTTDLDINHLTLKKDTIGNIAIKVSNPLPDVYDIRATLGAFNNEIFLAGDYNGASGIFDLQLDIERLELDKMEPFTLGYLNRMKGHIEGGVSLTGTVEEPIVIGNLLFRDAQANVPLLNSVFSLKDERIRFLRDGIHFNSFTLTDQNGKTAVLNGSLKTKNWLDYQYGLDFEANDFRVINSTRRDNKLFYGTLFLDTKISFRGNTDRPIINSYFRANDKTNLTMVMPQTDPEIAEKSGIVEFIDLAKINPDSIFADRVDSLNTSNLRGMSLSANLEISPNAQLTFVIDEGNGDMLVAKGKANLNTSIDPSGKISVTGTYEIMEGSYEMSVSLVKYRFTIEKGSTIVWTGEPTMADINITALYSARTAPYDLVENMIIGETAENRAKYKDRMAFNVKLKVKGELLKPDITFDIVIAETSSAAADVVNTVNSKLDQLRLVESEMNKQVFALMLLGTFVPENPFGSSSGGANASAFARQSVSKLLASQLNQLAGSLISGVDIDIGIDSDEDYSMGAPQTRTDLNVALSKRLLKDRLKITVGSNFELEGAARPNEKTTNIAGDIKADYMLTRSGQYILRAFRIDQYEVALQGQVVETGVTFIINMDFDRFKELFEKKKKTNTRPL